MLLGAKKPDSLESDGLAHIEPHPSKSDTPRTVPRIDLSISNLKELWSKVN